MEARNPIVRVGEDIVWPIQTCIDGVKAVKLRTPWYTLTKCIEHSVLYGSSKVPEEVFDTNVGLFYETVEEECNGAYTLLQILLDSWDKKALHHSWYLPDGHYAHCPIMQTKEKRINLSEWEYTPVAIVKENTTLKFGLSNPANVVHSKTWSV